MKMMNKITLDSTVKVLYPYEKAANLSFQLQANDPDLIYIIKKEESFGFIEVFDYDGNFIGFA